MKNNHSKKYICYSGYGSNKSKKHTVKQFNKTMRKHHIYDCLEKLCLDTKDKKVCKLTRKCNRRNKRKRKFSTNDWIKWSKAYYGKC